MKRTEIGNKRQKHPVIVAKTIAHKDKIEQTSSE